MKIILYNILVLFLVVVVVNTCWASLIIPDINSGGSFGYGIGGGASLDGAGDGSVGAGGVVASGASAGGEIIGDAGAEIAGNAGASSAISGGISTGGANAIGVSGGGISGGKDASGVIAGDASGDAGASGTISYGINAGGISAGGSKTIGISSDGISGSEDVGGTISDGVIPGGAISAGANADGEISGGGSGASLDGASDGSASAVGDIFGGAIDGDASAGGIISGRISAGGLKTFGISSGDISGGADVGVAILGDAISGSLSGDDAIDGSASAGDNISGDDTSDNTRSDDANTGDDISAAAGSSRRINLSTNLVKGFSVDISNGFTASEATSGSFIKSVQNLTATFVSDAGTANGTNVVLVNLQYFRSTLQAFVVNLQEHAIDVKNSIKRQALRDIERQIHTVDVPVNQLRQRVNDVRRKWSNDITRAKLALQLRANIWASKELANITTASDNNATTIADAKTLINDYVSRHTSYLAECADEADTQLLTSEDQVQTIIDRYETVVYTLMSQVQSCLETADNSSAGRQCANVAREPLLQLRRAPAEFTRLSADSGRLLSASYAGRACVRQTQAGFESEKARIKRSLNKLVAASTSD